MILISFTNQIILSNVKADENVASSDPPKVGPIGKLLQILGKFSTNIVPIFRFVVISVASNPPAIEIGYNETVTLELGMVDPETGEFELYETSPIGKIFAYRFLTFQVMEYPAGNDQGSWFVQFVPDTVTVEEGSLLKTNVSISLISPPTKSNAIQSGILKFRILDTFAYGNLWLPPKGGSSDKFISRGLWFLSASILMRYGKYSGTVDTEYKDIDVLVKVKPYHALRFDTTALLDLKPDQIKSIPITLQNLGNYNDSYSFRIAGGSNGIMLADPPSITLSPGERKNTYLSVLVPQSAFDYGTLHDITIEAYSIYDPNVTIDKQTINIKTQGLYVSEIGIIGAIPIIVAILLVAVFYINRRIYFIEKHCVKPDKPWEIPEEKRYLEKLKKKDKEKYEEVLKMMQDEYDSALLWYKYYCKKITGSKPVEKKVEIEKEEVTTKKEEKIEAPLKEEIKDQKTDAERLEKERIMSRIKHEQERQKKQLKREE